MIKLSYRERGRTALGRMPSASVRLPHSSLHIPASFTRHLYPAETNDLRQPIICVLKWQGFLHPLRQFLPKECFGLLCSSEGHIFLEMRSC